MDSVMAKLAKSRQKTVDTLVAEIAALEARRATASTPGQVLALDAVIQVKRQRLSKVREELSAFLELGKDSRQPELALKETSKEPPAPGPVTGKGRH